MCCDEKYRCLGEPLSLRISAQASAGAAKQGPAALVSDDSAPAALACCHIRFASVLQEA